MTKTKKQKAREAMLDHLRSCMDQFGDLVVCAHCGATLRAFTFDGVCDVPLDVICDGMVVSELIVMGDLRNLPDVTADQAARCRNIVDGARQ